MPRRSGGKTENIKQRAIYVYLPSIGMTEDWKERAGKAGTSISKFVIERVEDSIRREEGEESYLSRLQLIQKLSNAEEELKKLKRDNRLLKKLVDNLDTELKRYRTRPFLNEEFAGVRRFDRELIEILKENRLTAEEILNQLSIDSSEIDLVKAVTKQLDILEAYGLVEYSGRRWRWRG